MLCTAPHLNIFSCFCCSCPVPCLHQFFSTSGIVLGPVRGIHATPGQDRLSWDRTGQQCLSWPDEHLHTIHCHQPGQCLQRTDQHLNGYLLILAWLVSCSVCGNDPWFTHRWVGGYGEGSLACPKLLISYSIRIYESFSLSTPQVTTVHIVHFIV